MARHVGSVVPEELTMGAHRAGPRAKRRGVGGLWLVMATAVGFIPQHVGAQSTGVTTQGITGGMVVPSASVLPEGSAALTFGNYQEPQLGTFSQRRNRSLGFGLLPNFELFGRVADYQNPLPGTRLVNGPRDISANVKFQLPKFWRRQPLVAVGVNDLAGGAVYFRSAYLVTSDQWGFFNWSLGYARGSASVGSPTGAKTFDGVFGGVEALVGSTGLSLLAEHDGQQRHLGVRYQSPPIAQLADARLSATVQRSSGVGGVAFGQDRTTLALSLTMPLDMPSTAISQRKTLVSMPPPDWTKAGDMSLTREDRAEAIRRILASLGLERVRVGELGSALLVEYENGLFQQNEADPIGMVLGIAAEYAHEGIRRVAAVTLKNGIRLYETSVGAEEFRAFLRHGDATHVSSSLAVDAGTPYPPDAVRWAAHAPSPHRRLRLEIAPEFDYALATELSPFDYSLAASVKAVAPLWRGADVRATYVAPITNTENLEPGFFFENIRHRRGIRSASLNQAGWLSPHLYGSIGAGLYKYNRLGFQSQGVVLIPGRADQIHARFAAYEKRLASESLRRVVEGALVYRHVYSPSTTLEVGLQQFTDGSSGPSVELVRWFGDVSVGLFYRRGGIRQYAGLEFSIPLTPRRGVEVGPVSIAGTPRFERSVRTRLTDSRTSANLVIFDAVRETRLESNIDAEQLNSGRIGERYFISQLPRMRDAFLTFARPSLP
jgi:hypothetical protein